MSEYPTPWQRKTLWTSITAIAVAVLAALAVLLIWITGQVLGFLQPLLIPVAVAGVMAYLLEPVVKKLCAFGMSRLRAVLAVFAGLTVVAALVVIWVAPTVYQQGVRLAGKLPGYIDSAESQIQDFSEKYAPKFGLPALPFWNDAGEADEPATDGTNAGTNAGTPPGETTADTDRTSQAEGAESAPRGESAETALIGSPYEPITEEAMEWIRSKAPSMVAGAFRFIRKSVGGFLGAFGFLLSLILVPVYLFFFLKDTPKISESWSQYLPLRASRFKDEVVGSLAEINGYLINFFRGQLLVSMINGVLTGGALLVMGLDFALLVGLLVAVLGLIPFIGILLSWLPAVLIAAVQWPGEWFQPLMVTVIFIVVQQLEGLFISPKIVGDSVGLHPMTVIVSMIAWSLLLGGLLGAILAVPLTATLKVLLKRYIWEKKVLATTKTNANEKAVPDDG